MGKRNDSLDRWFFDDDEARRARDFFPMMLTHVKGRSGAFELQPWQSDLVGKLFGWKDKETGLRRYRYVYCEIPRKNGKTTLAAGILLYMLLVDNEIGSEVYSAATTRDQAGLVYEIAAKMVTNNPHMKALAKRLDSKKRLVTKDGFFQACSSEAGAIHGTNPHCVIFDELHEQPNRELWEAFQTGFGARDQPLFFSITTAGHDRSSICWEQHEYARAVEANPSLDERYLPALYSAEPEDDWTSEAVWEKANPCLDVSLKRDFLRGECTKAQEIPALENGFRRLHLNQWTEQESRIIQMAAWDDCKTEFTPEDYHGRTCYAGLDLSSTRDVTAYALLFPEDDGGATVMPWFWIPEANVSQRAGNDQRLIRNFAERGSVEVTDGNEVDIRYLSDRITEISKPFDVRHIGFDPWNASGVTQLLKENGIPDHVLLKMPQTFGTYNEPFKKLLSMLATGKIHHDGNEVLRWMASNVAHKEDPSGNIRPDKGKSAEKIDGICAMLMGLGLLIHYGSDTSVYSTEGGGVVLF
jgi:phage terminase large subunit-like protein